MAAISGNYKIEISFDSSAYDRGLAKARAGLDLSKSSHNHTATVTLNNVSLKPTWGAIRCIDHYHLHPEEVERLQAQYVQSERKRILEMYEVPQIDHTVTTVWSGDILEVSMDTGEFRRWLAQCHPSRIVHTSDESIPVDDDNVFSPRPEYVPAEKEDVPTLVY